jgi:uncharacterized 2Fe-2S/4Fe-4S cluster protein (DUF4445 family)
LSKQSVRVVFMPDSKEVWVISGATVKEALFAASIPISMPCGGHGRCGKCLVRISGKVSHPTAEEKLRLPPRSRGLRLACMARLEGDAEVTIPASSRLSIQKIADTGTAVKSRDLDPGIIKVFLGRRKGQDAWATLQDHGVGIEDVAINMVDPHLMDEPLRMDHEWRLGLHNNATVVVGDDEILGFEAGDTSSECFGIAIDVGTNTVVCSLIDLATGKELGITSTINPQIMHGDDVISRIRFSKTSGGLDMLQREIVHLINGLVAELTSGLGIRSDRIYICSAVGNTAMQHILVGVSPVDLGRAPYRAKLTSSIETLAARAGLAGHTHCRLIMPATIGGFVGGDMVALILSQGLHRRKVPVMAVDLGTNGEIVLAAGGTLAACSTAAGPAFEGERISSGVRAITGAIEGIRIAERKVEVHTIGKSKPVGLCGSGLIAAVSELLRVGVVQPSGRVREPGEIKQTWLADRVRPGRQGREFIITETPAIRLRQGDVREIQLGKAALCAGMKVLSSVVGVKPSEIRTVYVAGSFGSAVRPSHIRRLGIVPPTFGGRIRVIGNSAIMGAKMLLTSRRARREAQAIVDRTEHVELFARPEFKDEFYESMAFPSPKLRE